MSTRPAAGAKRPRESANTGPALFHTDAATSVAAGLGTWRWALGSPASATAQLLSARFVSPPVGPVPRAVQADTPCVRLGSQFKFVNRLEPCRVFARNFGDMEVLRGAGFEAEKRNLRVVNIAGLSGIGKTCFVDAALPHLRDVHGAALAESIWPGQGASHVDIISELLCACESQRNLRITPAGWAEATLSRQLGAALLAQWTKYCALRVGDEVDSTPLALAGRVASETFSQLSLVADLDVFEAIDLILSHATAMQAAPSEAAATAARRPALIVHLDEAQECRPELLITAVKYFCEALLDRGQRVFLVVTGLPSSEVVQALRWTSVESLDIILPLLDTDHMVEIAADLAGIAAEGVPVGIRNALWMLGGVPRFLEFFFAAAACKAGTEDTLGLKSTWEWLQCAPLPDLSEVVQMTCRKLYRPADTPGCILDALFSLAVSERHVPLTCVLDVSHPLWTVGRAQNARLVYWEGTPGGDGPVRMPPILLHMAHVAAGPSSGPRIVPLARLGASLNSGDNESLAISVFMHRLRAAQIANVATVQLTEIVGVPLPAGMEDVFVAVPQCFNVRVLDHHVVSGAGPQRFSTFVASTRAALTAAPTTTPAAFVNGRGAPFADAMLILQEINILLQEKQSVIARQREAVGATVPPVPPRELATEAGKIKPSTDVLPALLIFVSDSRGRDDQTLPEHTTVIASPELRRALLGPLVAGLRARCFEENDTRATSGAACAASGFAATSDRSPVC